MLIMLVILVNVRLDRLDMLDMPLGFGPSGDWHVIFYKYVNLTTSTTLSSSIAYLFGGVQISSLTVARRRGQLRPGASSRDFPHPPSTLSISLSFSCECLEVWG